MANRHSCVLVEQEHGDGLADNVATADDDGVLAGNGNVAALENLNDAGRRAGRKRRAAGEQAARVHGMKAVHIFCRIDSVEEGLRVNLRRERQLDEDAVDVIARIELGDEREHFFSGDCAGRGDEVAIEAKLGAGLDLAADVDLRCRNMTHKHGGKPRLDAVGSEREDLFGHFLLDGCGNGRAVEDLWHSLLQSSWYRFGSGPGRMPGGSVCIRC